MCSKITLGHRFDSKFWMVKIFWTRPKCFRKYTFGAWIWTQILYFFDRSQESYWPLNMSHWVIRNMDSNYVPLAGRENGSVMICSRIWLGNIFPISPDQSSWHKILGKKYISGMLFTSRNRLENVFKSYLRSPFRQ